MKFHLCLKSDLYAREGPNPRLLAAVGPPLPGFGHLDPRKTFLRKAEQELQSVIHPIQASKLATVFQPTLSHITSLISSLAGFTIDRDLGSSCFGYGHGTTQFVKKYETVFRFHLRNLIYKMDPIGSHIKVS